MFNCWLNGPFEVGYNPALDVFFFLGASREHGVYYCALERRALIPIAKSRGEKSPLEDPYPIWLLENILLQNKSIIDAAAQSKICAGNVTANRGMLIRESDISLN